MSNIRDFACLLAAALAAAAPGASARRSLDHSSLNSMRALRTYGDAPAPVGAYGEPAKKKFEHTLRGGTAIDEVSGECGLYVHDADIALGEFDIPGSGRTATLEECKAMCVAASEAGTPCNAAIVIPSGLCFMKYADLAEYTPIARPGFDMYIFCDESS